MDTSTRKRARVAVAALIGAALVTAVLGITPLAFANENTSHIIPVDDPVDCHFLTPYETVYCYEDGDWQENNEVQIEPEPTPSTSPTSSPSPTKPGKGRKK